jgi:hypothetical protein
MGWAADNPPRPPNPGRNLRRNCPGGPDLKQSRKVAAVRAVGCSLLREAARLTGFAGPDLANRVA